MKAVLKTYGSSRTGRLFGKGPYKLLRRVEATGSLHKAAAQMGMAYSHAWKLIAHDRKKAWLYDTGT